MRVWALNSLLKSRAPLFLKIGRLRVKAFLCKLCCRKLRDPAYKIYKQALKKQERQTDIVKLVETMSYLKKAAKIMLKPHRMALLKKLKHKVITIREFCIKEKKIENIENSLSKVSEYKNRKDKVICDMIMKHKVI